MVAWDVPETEHLLGTLVVVEVELAKEYRRIVFRCAAEQQYRMPVNCCPYVLIVAAGVLLRRRKRADGFQRVIHKACHTRIVRTATLCVVRLGTQAINRRTLLAAAAFKDANLRLAQLRAAAPLCIATLPHFGRNLGNAGLVRLL